MNEPTQPQKEAAAAASLVAEMYKDVVKGTLALPLEGCKSMATGCATVAGLYGATVAFINYGHPPAASQWQVYVILAPFLLWSFSGLCFGSAYLPNVRLEELLSSNSTLSDTTAQQRLVVEREQFLRQRIVIGSIVFWFALTWALTCIAFVRVPHP